MTREEAILWLQVLKHSQINWVGEQAEDKDIIARCEEAEQEAFDMAIEALSADDGLRCALAGGRKCFAQGYEFTWCITCPHISEEDRQLVNHAVLALPSAEAVQGEWKPFDLTWGRNVYFCTACQESTEVPTVNGQPSYNFCPNCGAKMTKGGDSE